MVKIEFKKEMKKNNTRWSQNGIIQMNEGNSKTFFDNIGKFSGSMDLNNIAVLRHGAGHCERIAIVMRSFNVFSSMAHTFRANYLRRFL